MSPNIQKMKDPVLTSHQIAHAKGNRATLIGFIALAIVALGIGTFLYWQLASNDVLEVRNNPVPVRSVRPHPSADGVVFLKVDYCKKVRASGLVRTSFVSPTREYFFPVSHDREDPGCHNTEIPVPVPHEVPNGTYHVHFRVTYQVNPLKSVVEEFDSKPFEVVPNESNQ
jgi:hypothetical protein